MNFPPKTNYPAKTDFEDTLNEDKKRTPRRVHFCYHIFKRQFHKKHGVKRNRIHEASNVEKSRIKQGIEEQVY